MSKLIIQRSDEDHGNVKPEAYNLLNSLPDEVLHHISYGYLHPLGIYNRSLSKVSNGFLEVLKELEEYEQKNDELKLYPKEMPKYDSSKLLNAQENLLRSIQSHIDDCFHILKSTSPYPDLSIFNSKQRSAMQRSAMQWLKIIKHPTVDNFQENIQKYKSHIDLIVNKLKHEHARLRDVILINNFEIRIGYFVETSGVDNGKVSVGPDLEIHSSKRGLSYSRDLSFHLYNIYEISFHLTNALLEAFTEQYKIVLSDDFYLKDDSADFKDIIKKVSQRNLKFFPKEYLKPVPIIELDKQGECTLTMCLDEEFRLNNYFGGTIRKVVSWTPDGTTKSFRFPLD